MRVEKVPTDSQRERFPLLSVRVRGPPELADAVLLLRDPNLGERGTILAAKRRPGLRPKVIADDDGLWDTDGISTTRSGSTSGGSCGEMVDRLG